ncbi:MAG: PEP/pyruvate-binding domain-containing protein, partial [Spirochaetota bacterium]
DRTYDYAKLISPGKPNLKPALRTDEIVRYSQKYIDVVNLEEEEFQTIPFIQLIKEYGDEYPALNKIVSLLKGDYLSTPVGILFNYNPEDCVITFDGLTSNPHFAKVMKEIIDTLKESYNTPVDIEFAHDGDNFYILQCRPQAQAQEFERVKIPTNVPKEKKLFTANKYIQTAQIMNIKYIVYIDPIDYDNIDQYNKLLEIGVIVSKLNNILPKREFILMGPGRWGSRGDIKLGVRVNYSDINNTSMLIEIARKKGGQVPDVSFGTHFFQDLVESRIHVMPLYPDDSNILFNEEYFRNNKSSLTELLPEYKDTVYENIVQVINVQEVSEGQTLNIIMDGESDSALAYLDKPTKKKSVS